MHKPALCKSILAFLAIVFTTHPGACLASSQADDAEMDLLFALSLEELQNIRVSSTSYFDETLWNSSATVSVINEDRWQQLAAQTLGDALSHLPATSVTSNFPGGKNISIRGYTSITSIRGIAVRLDDVPMNSYRSGTSMQDIYQFQLGALQKIEIVRGAGSALHGSDSFHGVISMTSRQAEPGEVEFALESDAHGFNQGHLLAGKQLNTQFNSSLALSYGHQPDQDKRYRYTNYLTQTQQVSERAEKVESYSAILKIMNKQNTESSFNVNFYALHQKNDQAPGSGRSFGGVNLLLDQDWGQKNITSHMVKVAYQQHDSVGNQFKFSSYVLKTKDLFELDARNTAFARLANEERHETIQGTSLTLKLNEAGKNNRLALGYEYRHGNLDKFIETNTLASGLVTIGQGPGVDDSREVHSLIIDGRYQIKPKVWQLVYGSRLDHYSDFGEHFSPRVSLINTVNPHCVYKLIYGHAFRAPVQLETLGVPPQIQDNPKLKPETIDSLEFSWLYRKNNWSTNVTVFQTKWQDGIIQTDSSDPNFSKIYTNQGKNESFGLELSARSYWQNWRIDGSASFVESKNLSDDILYEGFPPYILNMSLAKDMPENNLELFVNQRIHLNAKEGTPTTTNPNPGQLPNFYRTDLVLQWYANKEMTLRANVRNLFDRNNLHSSPYLHENGIPDRRFNFSLEIEYKM